MPILLLAYPQELKKGRGRNFPLHDGWQATQEAEWTLDQGCYSWEFLQHLTTASRCKISYYINLLDLCLQDVVEGKVEKVLFCFCFIFRKGGENICGTNSLWPSNFDIQLMSTVALYWSFSSRDNNCFCLSLSVVLFVINHTAEQWQRPFGSLLFKPPSQIGVNISYQINSYLDKFCCGPSIQKPDEVFPFTLFYVLQDWLFVQWEYFLWSSIYGRCIHHNAPSESSLDWSQDIKSQVALCSSVPDLTGICHKKSQSIRVLCYLKLCCLVSAEKVPFQQCHIPGVVADLVRDTSCLAVHTGYTVRWTHGRQDVS